MEKRIKYVLFGLLVASLTKSLILTPGLNEVLVTAILAGLAVFYEIKPSQEKLDKLQSQIDHLKFNTDIQNKNIDDLKNSMVSIKVSGGIRGLSGNNR